MAKNLHMASGRTTEESSAVAMSDGAVKNLILVVGAIALSVYASTWFMQNAGISHIRTVMRDLWPLQGILVGAVLAFVYRLSSDTTSVKGMAAYQRRKLDRMVATKFWRLWALAAGIAVPVLLVRIDEKFESAATGEFVLWLGMTLAFFTALLCFYVPPMWLELRRFVTALVSQAEDDERIKDQLKRLRGKSED